MRLLHAIHDFLPRHRAGSDPHPVLAATRRQRHHAKRLQPVDLGAMCDLLGDAGDDHAPPVMRFLIHRVDLEHGVVCV